MAAGDIADGTGALWVRAWGRDADGALTIDQLIRTEHGSVWLTPHQADLAHPFGWHIVSETTGLVRVERSEGEAEQRRHRAAALSDLAKMDGDLL